jgi:hypothetical protein
LGSDKVRTILTMVRNWHASTVFKTILVGDKGAGV